MEILRTLVTTGPNDQDQDQLDNWPLGMPAEGFFLDLDMPVNVGAAVATAADLRNALAYFLGNVTIRYKLGHDRIPYDGVDGAILRNIHRCMTLREVWNDFVGVLQAAGDTVWHARIFLTPQRQNARTKERRLIGWTQGRSTELTIAEAGAPVAGVAFIGRAVAPANATCRVIPAYRAGPDKFSDLPFYREVNRAARDVSGPDGTMLAVWDDNAALGGTAITRYRLKLGDEELVRLVEPRYVGEEYARVIDAGAANISDEVTPLYMADPYEDEADLVPGPCYFSMVNQDVASILCRFLYLPAMNEHETASIVAAAAQEGRSDINAVLPEPSNDPRKNGTQASAPMTFLRRDDARFASLPGLLGAARTDGARPQAQPFVPPGILAQAGALKSIDAPGSQSLITQAQKRTMLRMPGITTSLGKGVGAAREAVRGAFRKFF